MGTLRKERGRWLVDFRLPRNLAIRYGCKRFRRYYAKKALAKKIHGIVSGAIASMDAEGVLERLLSAGQVEYTVQTFYDRWIKEYVTPRLEKTTKTRYELSFKTINGEWGNLPLAEFKRENLHLYVKGRISNVSGSTVNKDIIAIKSMFGYAAQIGVIDSNPLAHFPALRVQEKARRIPTHKEFLSLVNAMPDPAIAAMVAIMGETGIRRSEAINLEWKNVNLRAARISLERTKSKRVRTVPLSKFAIQKLQGLTRFVHQPRVFCHQLTGTPWLSPDKEFRAARKKVGLGWITFHTLRHMRATRWIKFGADIETVREALGHLDIKTTDRYAKHVQDRAESSIREAQEREKTAGMAENSRSKNESQSSR